MVTLGIHDRRKQVLASPPLQCTIYTSNIQHPHTLNQPFDTIRWHHH